ncbi:gastrula zinc finger protein xFG20-1-like [Cylas formicarius]|uniref:gastrula zinc finger protein xFG20-1-like n=1 Tax=Cylas formicarius TaxID=197179 RepID=UPI002958AC11|nr:gastrula zinc finger protein xFG20-1-like [Cylas formicarius]
MLRVTRIPYGKIRHNSAGEFVCPRCSKSYKHKTSVYTHIKQDCGQSPKYFCDLCQFACKYHHVLSRHKTSLSHRRREMKLSVVEPSVIRLSTVRALVQVQPQHAVPFEKVRGETVSLQVLPERVHVKVCLQEAHAPGSSALRLTSRLGTHRCVKCGKLYRSKSALNRHVRYDCGQEKRFACVVPACGYKAYQKVHLTSHLMRKLFNCHNCERRYKLKTSLYNHLKYECGKSKSFVCTFCQKTFRYKHSLRDHMNHRRHGRDVHVEQADRVSPFSMVRQPSFHVPFGSLHVQLPQEETKQNNLEPQDLSRTSSARKIVISENRLLTPKAVPMAAEQIAPPAPEQKVFECNFCKKKYQNYVSLTRHKKYECQKPPQFACHMCSFKTRYQFTLRAHLFRLHQVVVENCVNYL